jgi:hypothetical protein
VTFFLVISWLGGSSSVDVDDGAVEEGSCNSSGFLFYHYYS